MIMIVIVSLIDFQTLHIFYMHFTILVYILFILKKSKHLPYVYVQVNVILLILSVASLIKSKNSKPKNQHGESKSHFMETGK